jgi:hypothetical protein
MDCDYQGMSKKHSETDSAVVSLRNDSARQRWELFHRAIAHAKESNHASLNETEFEAAEPEASGPLLSIVR